MFIDSILQLPLDNSVIFFPDQATNCLFVNVTNDTNQMLRNMHCDNLPQYSYHILILAIERQKPHLLKSNFTLLNLLPK